MKILSTYNIDYLKTIISTIKLFPSLRIGNKRYHYLFPREVNVIMYITNRCNSRCLHCNHWKQTPKYDLSIEVIEDLLNSKTINKNGFLLEGGEGSLHPHFEEILNLFKGKHFTLLTNGILTDKVVRLVEKYRIPSVSISLDGARSTYKRIRGIDGYEEGLKTIDQLKDRTNLGVCFTLTPWNTYEDYLHVQRICLERNLRLLFNIFASMEYMGARDKEDLIDPRFEQTNNLYVNLYNDWIKGKLVIPCLSMRNLAVIRPNGEVVLCQYKDIILGNLYERSFDEIWNDENTKSIQRQHRFCNDCWVSSHRAFDTKFTFLIKKMLPRHLAKKVIENL